MRREGLLEHNTDSLVSTPKLERKIPAHLDIGEMQALLEAPDHGTPLGRRDSAILELFYRVLDCGGVSSWGWISRTST